MGLHVDLNKPGAGKEIEAIFDRRVRELMKSATIEFWRTVTVATPVDTGRARWGWYCTVNAPSGELPPEGEYSMPSVADHSEIAENYTVSDKLYIANNLPYIGRLNKGYSKQAPALFVQQAAAQVQNAVAKLIANIK